MWEKGEIIARERQEKRQEEELEEKEQRQEEERVKEIQNARISARRCRMCGQPLGILLRLLRKDRHIRCRVFRE